MSQPPWDEAHLAEDPAVELLRDHLGYTYAAAELLEVERQESFKEPILAGRLARALRKLNPWLSESNLAAVVRTITDSAAASLGEANEKLYVALTYGPTVEQDTGDGKKSRTVRVFDFDQPGNNEYLVTRQYKVLGSRKHVIPDVVAFVNGLPLAVIECKSPTIGDKWKAEAVGQLRRSVLSAAIFSSKWHGLHQHLDSVSDTARPCSTWRRSQLGGHVLVPASPVTFTVTTCGKYVHRISVESSSAEA